MDRRAPSSFITLKCMFSCHVLWETHRNCSFSFWSLFKTAEIPSAQTPAERWLSSWKGPFCTSMLVGGRVIPLLHPNHPKAKRKTEPQTCGLQAFRKKAAKKTPTPRPPAVLMAQRPDEHGAIPCGEAGRGRARLEAEGRGEDLSVDVGRGANICFLAVKWEFQPLNHNKQK